MANTTNTSRKRTSARVTQGENEVLDQDNGRRQRNPTKRQQQLNDDQAAKLKATIERQNKELAKQRQKLAEYEERNANNDETDASDPGPESKDEEDMGFGARSGGGFTSVKITSMGTVPYSQSAAQKRQLIPENDPFPELEERRPLQTLDKNLTSERTDGHDDLLDFEDDMAPLPLSSPLTSLPPASSPSIPQLGYIRHERTTPPSSPHSEINEDLQPPPRKRTKLPPAPFRQGCAPGPKPKAADYEEGVEKMLLNAMHEYACLILTVDAFPDEVKQTRWAKATWQTACEEVDEHYECSTRMIRLITGRGSWARGFLKDAARKNFKVFKFKEGSTEEIKRYNQDLRHSLLRDDAFHHKNRENVTGFAEHCVIIDILRDALFEDNKSYGVKYSRYFNPVSINLLALVFTMIEFLINEWSTGEHTKATFRSKNHSMTFEAHYLRAQQWSELEPTVTMNIRKRMFKTLMKKAGASDQVNGASESGRTGMTESMKERAKEALVGRTGETDDEDD